MEDILRLYAVIIMTMFLISCSARSYDKALDTKSKNISEESIVDYNEPDSDYEFIHFNSTELLKTEKTLLIDDYGHPNSELIRTDVTLIDTKGNEEKTVNLNSFAFERIILEDKDVIIFIENEYIEIFNTELNKIKEIKTGIHSSFYYWSGMAEGTDIFYIISSDVPSTTIDFEEDNEFHIGILDLLDNSYAIIEVDNDDEVFEYKDKEISLNTKEWKK